MFAAIYFGQVAFAALPFTPVTPPPPPVPPIPHHYSCRFAIGQVLGTADPCAQPVRVGFRNAIAGVGIVATRGNSGGLKLVGSRTGPNSGTCP